MMQNEENIDDEVKVSDSSLIIKIALAVAVIFGLISISIACVTGGFSISFIFAFFMAIISLIIALDANYNTRKMAQANLNGIVRKAFTSRYTFFK